ncbi:AICARFT/IMPCHase bienzyme [Actinomyces sp. Chiba101]|uniref:DUF3017 domain-containing protein n=1 Tax=Actinomyces denticolens TaxID=52767 RepID=A0ABY1I080_9ACTO|nr:MULTISPECIES: DUF3017 domain-containing protein [Actinomyces]BAW92647.1 AICARFT/IMPCHase bienzyme [Actinomyces sp. Chiba101]GAV94389.1 hypothetical protein ADENT20671_1158 [Actinomyces denticolens]SHI40390.1 hypothetical protein SAMN05216246_10214 [Actinomyces denticolens]SUU07836.1 Uncharacterised protein [Actinomyces denticolens]
MSQEGDGAAGAGTAVEPVNGADGPARSPQGVAPARSRAHQTYRSAGVLAVALCLAVVPAISLLGHQRLGVIALVVLLLTLVVMRFQRPQGTWISARSRLFDVVFGALLALALLVLAPYADLPRIFG